MPFSVSEATLGNPARNSALGRSLNSLAPGISTDQLNRPNMNQSMTDLYTGILHQASVNNVAAMAQAYAQQVGIIFV